MKKKNVACAKKNKNIILPICLCCKNIIQLMRIEIVNSNSVYCRYLCNCKSTKVMDFDKYYYGLSILSNIGYSIFFEAFCLTCNSNVDQFSLSSHKTHLLSPLQIKDFVKNCPLHNNSLEYVCLKCNINICLQCTKENHKDHNCLTVMKYSEKIKKDIIDKYKYKIKVVIKKRLIKEKQKNKKLINALNEIYTFFIHSFKAISKRPHYNLCFSLANLKNITYSNIPYKVKYKQNKILRNIGYGKKEFKVLEDIMRKEKKHYDRYCYHDVILLNDNYVLIHIKLIEGRYVPFIEEPKGEVNYFIILDPELKEIYQYYLPYIQKISHLKDNLYCVCGIHFFYIWDSTNIADHFPEIIMKYDVEYICAIDAVLLDNDTLVVLRLLGITKINLKKKKEDKKYPSVNLKNNNGLMSQIFHLQNNDIVLVDKIQFIIVDVSVIEELKKKYVIIFNEINNSQHDENKSGSFECFYSNLSPNKILICSLCNDSFFTSIVGYDLNDKCKIKFKVSNFGEIYNKFLFIRDDLCIGAGQNEYVWLFDPNNGETYSCYQGNDHYMNLTTITNLKYGYYLLIQKDIEFILLYGGIE